ncbi:MAG: hypothetical protein WA101_02220 [Minisyncoccia bacterium]
MSKIFAKVAIFVFFVLFSIQTTSAAIGLDKPFGGKITNNKATEIENAEKAGYTCFVPGVSITVKPVNVFYPTSYIIPYTILFKNFSSVGQGNPILGLYNVVKTTVKCSKSCPPPPWNKCIKIISLDTIKLFGTSKL